MAVGFLPTAYAVAGLLGGVRGFSFGNSSPRSQTCDSQRAANHELFSLYSLIFSLINSPASQLFSLTKSTQR